MDTSAAEGAVTDVRSGAAAVAGQAVEFNHAARGAAEE